MARIWSSGFESGSASNGVEWDSQQGSASVTTTNARSGTYAGRINNTGFDRFEKRITSSNDNGPFYVRAYVRFASFGDTYWYSNPLLYLGADSGFGYGQINLNTNGTLELWDKLGQIGSSSSTLSLNTWYCIELKLYNNTGSGKMELEGRIDGSTFASTTTSTNTGGVQYLRLGTMSGAGGTPMDVYFDDVAVNDGSGSYQNSWVGEGKIVHLTPTGAGDNNTWLKSGGGAGDSNNYQEVDEVVPDDATTYLKRTSTTIKVDDYNVTNSSTAGIGSSDTINVVAVGIRGGATNATAATSRDVLLRLKSAASGTVVKSASSTNRLNINGWLTHSSSSAAPPTHKLVSYTDPTTGVAWTPTGTNSIDNMQIGVENQTSATTEVRVSAMWALVDYTPVTSTDLTITKSESVGVSEAVQRLQTSFVERSDSVTVAEATSSLLSSLVTVTDSSTVTENSDRLVISQSTVSDSVNGSEQVSLLLPWLLVSVSDTSTVSESVTVALDDLTLAVSDSSSVAESVSGFLTVDLIVSDAPVVTESISVLIPTLLATLADSTTLTEEVELLVTSFVSTSDSSGVTESVALEFEAVASLTITVSDTTTLNEAITPELDGFVTLAETITLTEDTQLQLGTTLSVAESISVTDSSDQLLVAHIDVTDTATITETTVSRLDSEVTINDTVTVSDTAQLSFSLLAPLDVALTDAVSLAEGSSLLVTSFLEKTDTSTVSDVPELVIPWLDVAVSDSSTVTEAVTQRSDANVALSESSAVSDEVVLQLDGLITVSESVVVAETVTLEATSFIETSDTTTLTDTLTVAASQPDLALSVSDAVSLSDSPTPEVVAGYAIPRKIVVIDGLLAYRVSELYYVFI